MRRDPSLAASLSLVLGLWCCCAVLATAAGPGNDQLIKKDKVEVKTETVRGTLQSVDGSELKVAQTDKTPLALQITSGTMIQLDGKQATLSELQRGQQVVCTYMVRAGSRVCLAVSAQSEKK